MSESFEFQNSVEKEQTVEALRGELEIALVSLENAAMAVGKFESGLPEADFGMADNLAEAETAALAAIEKLVAAIKKQGEAAGLAARQGELPV
jgi:hypothetical protein